MNMKRSWCIKHVYAVIFMFMWVLQHSGASKCIEKEREALLAIKKDLVDEENRLSSWVSSGGDCCKWEGVFCDNHTGHLLRLDLAAPWIPDMRTYRALRGTLSPKLIELRNLTYLDLSNNQIQGDQDIVLFIGALTNLRYLDLSNNQFCDGQIIYKLGNLTHLEYLNLALSCFGDSDAVQNLDSLLNHNSLRYLDLSGHNLSRVSDWLEIVSKLSNLRNLTLDYCGLSPPNLSYTNTSSYKSPLASVSLSFNPTISSSIFKWLFNYNTTLVYLDLSATHLPQIPNDAFRNMRSLSYLSLYRSGLSGPIPPNIFRNMSSLAHLSLSHNELSGPVSESIGLLSSLEELFLEGNNLSGRIPESIGNLSSLEVLDLSANRLSGRLPDSIGQLFDLKYLNLSVNPLQGLVSEVHFSNLSKLVYLDLADNNGLVFDVNHSDWIPPFQLYVLNLRSCKLGPDFPKWLATQKRCSFLDVSHAEISDVLPNKFWSLFSSFTTIDFSHNAIRGTFGNSTMELEGLTFYVREVRFSSNQMEGQIPSFLSSLSYLDLSKNKFSDISSFLCSPNPLVWFINYLDLSSCNHVDQQLPDCWTRTPWPVLQLLDLSNNSFSGTIPDSIGSLSLETLKLRSNILVGELPSSLMNYTNLKVIDLADNKLSGSVPEWIGVSFPSLVILMLQSNHFTGSLPPQLCQLKHILNLDFSDNDISGTIPSCLDGLTALAEQENSNMTIRHDIDVVEIGKPRAYFEDDATFIWKGSMSEYKNTLGLVKRIDLSSNRLTGEIPSEVTRLVGLVSLNLSRNNLTGHIPQDIGMLDSLDSLDMSRNQIGGEIPTSLGQINRLSYLDLSNNNLSGEIPTGTQIRGFDPSVFAGNPHLCGLPLPNMCAPVKKTNQDDQEDTDKLITRGFYITLALGFVVGFWGVCGSLIFKRRWRYAYYRFLDALNDWFYVKVTLIKRQFKDRYA